jgi:hypothetical protein
MSSYIERLLRSKIRGWGPLLNASRKSTVPITVQNHLNVSPPQFQLPRCCPSTIHSRRICGSSPGSDRPGSVLFITPSTALTPPISNQSSPDTSDEECLTPPPTDDQVMIAHSSSGHSSMVKGHTTIKVKAMASISFSKPDSPVLRICHNMVVLLCVRNYRLKDRWY